MTFKTMTVCLSCVSIYDSQRVCSAYVVIRYVYPDTRTTRAHATLLLRLCGLPNAGHLLAALGVTRTDHAEHLLATRVTHSHTDISVQLPLHSRLCLSVYMVVVCGR